MSEGRSRSQMIGAASIAALGVTLLAESFVPGHHNRAGTVSAGVVALAIALARWYVPARHQPFRQEAFIVGVVVLVGALSTGAAVISLLRHRSAGYVIVYGVAGAGLLAPGLNLLIRLRRLHSSMAVNDGGLTRYPGAGKLPPDPGSDEGKT